MSIKTRNHTSANSSFELRQFAWYFLYSSDWRCDIMSREEFRMGYESVKETSGVSVRTIAKGGGTFPWILLVFTSTK